MKLWALTAYYNPCRYWTRLRNYHCFRRHLPVPLLTIEWAPDGAFQLSDHDAEILVRLEGGDLMWQKERLLSLAAARLPPDCEAVVLMDADILLLETTWPERLRGQLNRVPLVQPFQEVHHLPPLSTEALHAPELLHQASHEFYLARQSFADLCVHGVSPTAIPTTRLDTTPDHGVELQRLTARPSFGHAWAIRRDWLEEIGLYQHSIAGSGDLAFAMAIAGRAEEYCSSYSLNAAQRAHYLCWATVAAAAAGPCRIGRLEGLALHLFHGHLSRRNYRARLDVLASSGFDPATDLVAAKGQPFHWARSSRTTKALRHFFSTYFQGREEDEGQQPPISCTTPEAAGLLPLLARAGLAQESYHVHQSWSRPGGKTLLQLRSPEGKPLKVRSFPTADAAMAMVHLRGQIGEHPGFACVLAWNDTLVLEEWVEGMGLTGPTVSPAQAGAAGALLADLHRLPLPLGQPAEAPVQPLLEQCLTRLRELTYSDALPAAVANRLAEELQARPPRMAWQGLLHFDFCGENLVWREGRGVVSIDNERLRIGPVACDIGRSMARWPLSPAAREAFLAGYRSSGGPAESDHHAFWLLMAHVSSAWFRVRHDQANAALPLQALQAWQSSRWEEGG